MGLLHRSRAAPAAAICRSFDMQDILWTGLTLSLLAASLGYVALCDRA
ncbi:hypothetical protein [Novosphingobium soli]|uniref:Uncharacterized protein n=1 Tax=Novosphingobium soli TaxID=574956 RepID=A0ABV6CZC1_9SPHN